MIPKCEVCGSYLDSHNSRFGGMCRRCAVYENHILDECDDYESVNKFEGYVSEWGQTVEKGWAAGGCLTAPEPEPDPEPEDIRMEYFNARKIG